MIILLLLAISFLGIYASIWFLLLFLQKRGEFHKQLVLKKFPKVSVIIPAHNEEKIISRALNSILKIDYPKDRLKVIVVDDGSSDKTYEIARRFANRGVEVYRKVKGGKASAVNYGLGKVRSNLILTIDTDCFLERDALKKLVSEIQDEQTMAAIPSIEVFKPKGILQNIQQVEYSFMNFFRKLTSSIYSLTYAPAAVLFKSQFFRKYGRLDEKTITEDFEIGLRINLHNFNIAHAFDAKVFTIVPASFYRLMRQRVRWAYGSFSELKKHKKLLSFDYGDLGAFVLPQIIIWGGILVSVLFLGASSMVYEVLHSFNLLRLTGYDVMASPFLNLYSYNPLLDVRAFIIVFSLMLSILTYLLVRRTKRGEVSFIYFLVFIFLYSWLLAFFQLVALLHFLLGKKPGW